MISSFKYTNRSWTVFPLILLLFSCATYNTQISKYYELMASENYVNAFASLDNIKRLKTGRNRLLYLFEKGKMAHHMGLYDSSNLYFNEADLFMEDVRTSTEDIIVGNLLNPMMEKYKGEDFERFMVHYYKALNYLYLGNIEDALVEARRITLQSYRQQDKTSSKENHYSNDAFSLILQGIIYEKDNDVNNAFISYRNAADIFLKNKNSYFGVALPEQLQQDVLRTAMQNGFSDQVIRYEKLFNTTYKIRQPGSGGELVLIWENGLAPIKVQQDFFFMLNKDAGGSFFFTDAVGLYNIPFDFSSYEDREKLSAANLRSLRVAFPRYQEQPLYFQNAVLNIGGKQYAFEVAEDINTLAPAILQHRFLKEMSKTLTRIAVKKIAEEAARPKTDAKNKDEKEALALTVQIFNFLSEKADTRNWQSLPRTIFYSRIPLEKGENVMTLDLAATNGNPGKQVIINAEGRGELEVRNVSTIR
ncbi:MAG: hypothetical protein H7Y03_01805 [Chitinophagaceae bacterium]|nr:hypothetical protein [Chitinophagaceae bacterium]